MGQGKRIYAVMEFHAFDRRGGAHVMTTHRAQDDETPLQLISVKRLQQLLALEDGMRNLAGLIGLVPRPDAEETAAGDGAPAG